MNTQQEQLKDMGDMCLWCRKSSAFGSGRFVNRIPASTETEEGYQCGECEAEFSREFEDDMIRRGEQHKELKQ